MALGLLEPRVTDIAREVFAHDEPSVSRAVELALNSIERELPALVDAPDAVAHVTATARDIAKVALWSAGS